MKPACRSFRSLLEEKLVGRPDPLRLSSLSWHEHLLGCGACRALFESEETLEVLLATLPEPNLPPEIKRRVLAALARSKTADRELDRLLSRDVDVTVPANLAKDVLARLEPLRAEAADVQGSDALDVAAERDPVRGVHADARLDALLERALAVNVPDDLARRTLSRLAVERGVEALQRESRLDVLLERAADVAVPGGLSDRVLSGLARERRSGSRRPTRVRSAWVLAAAALVVATLLCWALWPKRGNSTQPDMVVDPIRDRETHSAPHVQPDGHRPDDQLARVPDPKMLAELDVLENWDLLWTSDVDVLLASSTEPADELLLDYQEGG